MKAELLRSDRTVLSAAAFATVKIWKVPAPVHGSRHAYKYSLALVVNGECVLRYDNESGKGDHRHAGRVEEVYAFRGVDRLVADFEADVRRWLK